MVVSVVFVLLCVPSCRCCWPVVVFINFWIFSVVFGIMFKLLHCLAGTCVRELRSFFVKSENKTAAREK